jgi:hypothetical protein
VDNRVEAPSRSSGEGSGSTVPGAGSDGAAPSGSPSASSSAADSAAPSKGGQAQAQASDPAESRQAPAAEFSGSRPPADSVSRSGASTPRGPGGTQQSPSFAPIGSPAGAPAGGPPTNGQGPSTAAMAAVAGAASGARGLASKVGSSFSGISKTRPKPKPKAKPRPKAAPVRRPGVPGGPGAPGAGPLPRTQQSSQPTRRALLSLERIEPLSVMKFSFLISLVGWVVCFVAVAVIYFALSKLGVFAKIEQTVGLITYNKTHPGSNASSWFSASRVLEYTALVCTINAVLFTALATVGAALYNLVTHLTGGIEVTLRESD